jgi:ATP-binding cassette subfamily B protein
LIISRDSANYQAVIAASTPPKIASKRFSSAAFAKLLALVRPHTGLFTLGMLALGGGAAINLLFPQILGRLASPAYWNAIQTSLTSVAGAIVALFALQGVCFYFRSYLFGIIGQRVVADLREKLYNALIVRPIEFFDAERTGDLVSRLSSDTVMIQDAVSIKLSVFIRYALQVLVGLVLMCLISLRLTAAIVIVLPVIIGLSLVLGARLRRYSKLQQTALARSSSVAEETFSGARVVKAFTREPYEMERYRAANAETLRHGLSRTKISAFFSSFVSFILNAAIVVVVAYGVHLVGASRLDISQLTAFLMYGVIVAVSFAFVAGGYGDFVQALGACERVFELAGLPPPPAPASPRRLAPAWRGDVHFENVAFAYPTRAELSVLRGISLELKPGSKTALVGPSGAGKSTLVNLLLGFYAPTSGNILAGDIPLAEIDIEAFRKRVALVPQDVQLFGVSIAENLRYGKSDASNAELEDACRKSNILDFIRTLPQGFDTAVGERGVQLSGGQKQRIAIARAMLRDPALLILDEATSALDSENEFLIQSALETLMAGRTALIIAHRLSTVKNCDVVAVLGEGRVVQQGAPARLAAEEGPYRRMVERQELDPNARPNGGNRPQPSPPI